MEKEELERLLAPPPSLKRKPLQECIALLQYLKRLRRNMLHLQLRKPEYAKPKVDPLMLSKTHRPNMNLVRWPPSHSNYKPSQAKPDAIILRFELWQSPFHLACFPETLQPMGLLFELWIRTLEKEVLFGQADPQAFVPVSSVLKSHGANLPT